MGQAAAVVAHGDDPSAIFFNPALINRLEGTRMEIGTTLLMPSREFTSADTGRRTDTKGSVFFPSTLFVTHTFPTA
jgi:long-chain fatty acid transport protein